MGCRDHVRQADRHDMSGFVPLRIRPARPAPPRHLLSLPRVLTSWPGFSYALHQKRAFSGGISQTRVPEIARKQILIGRPCGLMCVCDPVEPRLLNTTRRVGHDR